MLPFKIIGFILIVLTTTLFGFFKANALVVRYKKLCIIKSAIIDLKQRIRLSHLEIEKLIALSFKNIPDYKNGLNKSDIEILDSFFKNLGISDTKAECEKCELCIYNLETQISAAEKDNIELNRLYKSVGFFSGIFICIFFL